MAQPQLITSHRDNSVFLYLKGNWTLPHAASLTNLINQHKTQVVQLVGSTKGVVIDGRELENLDTFGAMVILRHFTNSAHVANGTEISLDNCSNRATDILRLTQAALATPTALHPEQPQDILTRVGKGFVNQLKTFDEILRFVGEIAIVAFTVFRTPRRFRFLETTNQIQATGFEAVGIVALVTFLIGIVIAYLTGIQMERYGANIFIVDGIALGMARELAPLLVAIVLAGRSGSAFTAQLGTMKLNQEVDALETLGLSPIEVLVLPRVLGLMIVMPLLVFIGDVAGIFGGLVAADLRLGVSAPTFIERLRVVLPIKTVMIGLLKAPVFAFFIAAIACHLGLTTEPNARSVGEHTTKTVVRAIVAVILLNAAFAVILSELGI